MGPDALRDSVIARLRDAGCVFAEDESDLLLTAAHSEAQLSELIAKRVDGHPLETLLGWSEFDGRRIVVRPGVFVPRQRTVRLVDAAADRLQAGAVVVDLCCGSGAIARALLDRLGSLDVHAVDVDPVAVECARTNLPPPSTVYVGDLFGPLPERLRGRVDVVVANVPYVPTAAIALMPPEAREHETRVSLDGGPDGLAMVGRVASVSPKWLSPGGWLFVETSTSQADPAVAIFAAAGLRAQVLHDDEREADVIIGQYRPG